MTWTAPEIARTHEPRTGDELTMLRGWLDFHRQTLLLKCAGLTGEQLRRAAVEPSRLTLLGLVRHMAEVERWWFRRHAAGMDLPDLYGTEEDPDADFNDLRGDPEEDFATFEREVALAREAIADVPLEHAFQRRDREMSVRWVYLHMIEEYARHNGHADLLRERIDGVTGD